MTSSVFPSDRSYTGDHEWVMLSPGAVSLDEPVRVGLTAVAVEALGDLVFLDLPEVGSLIVAGEPCGEVESTKTVSDLLAPAGGRVTLINADALADPDIVTSDPYGRGWLFAMLVTAPGELLTAAEYADRNGSGV